MHTDHNKKIGIVSLVICGVFLTAGFAFAQISSSSNYQIFTDTFSSGGATDVGSSNYEAVMTVGEATQGLINSANYSGKTGFPAIEREPSISVSPSTQLVTLGTLTTAAVSFGSHTIEVYSNSRTGYTLRVYGDTLMNANSDTIDAIGGTNAASTPGTEQFGINLVANTTPSVGAAAVVREGVVQSPYATADMFAYQSGDIIAEADTFSIDTYTVSYIANITDGTAAGNYETTLTYAISSDF